MISPLHHSNGTGEIKFKITVDGKEYIYGPSLTTVNRSKRFVVGSILPFTPETADNGLFPGVMGSYGDIGWLNYGGALTEPPNIAKCYLTAPAYAVANGSPYLYFKESFKFEVLINTVSTSTYSNRAGINYMRFA